MNKQHARLAAALWGLVAITPSTTAQSASGALPPAPPIPGITAPDPFPNACVDCHTVYPDRNLDARLSAVIGRWGVSVDARIRALAQATAPAGLRIQGRHPAVVDAFESIPDGCLKCHDAQSRLAPPLGALLHAIHLGNGVENHFLTVFQGECTYCHKLDPDTGRWSMPSGPELMNR